VSDWRRGDGFRVTTAVFTAALLVLLAMVGGAFYRQRRLNESLRAQLETAEAGL